MFADRAFESSLGGDGWYLATQRNAGATQSLTMSGIPSSTAIYQGGGPSLGQFSLGLLFLLILGYVGWAYTSRKHSL